MNTPSEQRTTSLRTAIVTGARGGIGEATANKFLSLGDRVYGTDLSFDGTSHEFIEVICDVTDPDARGCCGALWSWCRDTVNENLPLASNDALPELCPNLT